LREFSESFSLPKDLNIKDLKSKMTDGLLVIEAKMPVLIEAEKKEKQKEKQILIEHKTLD
jgi:HSP20 family molecular chaperone IbpA